MTRGEAMLQLFNVGWRELAEKMPEIAEAGYTSLWLPPPAKAGSVYSVGYDLFDPFDLGDVNQRGTVATRYGTKAELLQAIETAHRFGLRVYFDNIMNHRGFDIPGYNASTPTNIYPGLAPRDFHLRVQSDGTFRNWDNISDWGNPWQIQHRPLSGLLDLANEPGGLNENFGATEGATAPKVSFLRQPGHNNYYMDTNAAAIAGPWRPFNGTNGDPVVEDVNLYLIRAALWTLAETHCDGFRLDAVKHTPATFFGATSPTVDGYVGALQTMFDYVHGYGANVTGNGYLEGDDNRNSCFDTETPRNDALLFGEHLGEPPGYNEYLARGMRLVDAPLASTLNNVLGNPSASLSGLDQRDSGGFAAPDRVMFAQSHDNAFANHRELQLAYLFAREGIPVIYSDGYNESSGPDYFPRVANAPYLGQFGDNKMPELAYLHEQLARGGTRPRWSDNDTVAFERYDYRDSGSAADQTVVLFAMNDNYSGAGADALFLDGEGDLLPGGTIPPGAGGDRQGLVVGFPPGSVLVQLAVSAPGHERSFRNVTVRAATNVRSVAQNSGGSLVYVGGQSIPPGGGAIEILVPSGGYVMYGYQWPEASRAAHQAAITLRQNGTTVPRLTVYRHDGTNGDAGFNPVYPFAMRGSVDAGGNPVAGVSVSNQTYAIDVPVVTNATFDFVFRTDASAVNLLAKLDGGLDLNRQLSLGPTNGFDRRDNPPGSVSDVFLGYEQTQFQLRSGPEKFAALATNRNNTVSDGAETYQYTVGAGGSVVNGNGQDWTLTTGTAAWVIHNPGAPTTISGGGPATQRIPLNPTNGGPTGIYLRAGYEFQVSRCVLYYTVDGSNPEGSRGVGLGTTKVVEGGWVKDDAINGAIDWWQATIPAVDNTNGAQIRYKIALYNDNLNTISDADAAKRYGVTQFAVTNFNPTLALVWLHNDRNTNETSTGLREGFHIIRARAFLPRGGKSSVFNTFFQTFYYDAAPPAGVMAYPVGDGEDLTGSTYQFVVRADRSVTGVEFNISDSAPNNDDAVTGADHGNGLTNGASKFASALRVTPNGSITSQYPNLPQEFRFNYVNIPSNGSATVTVRLREATSSLFANRTTTLTRVVNTLAPPSVLVLNNPNLDGAILVLNSNAVFPVQACFSSGLGNDTNSYSLYIHGALQPRSNYVMLASGCGAGLRSLYYNWNAHTAGSNTITVTYSNGMVLSATRSVAIARPGDSDGDGMNDYPELLAGTNPLDANSVLRITGLANGNQLVVWDSVPGRNYQVLATTNLAQPMQVISPVIQASSSSSFYFDRVLDATNQFYRIQVQP